MKDRCAICERKVGEMALLHGDDDAHPTCVDSDDCAALVQKQRDDARDQLWKCRKEIARLRGEALDRSRNAAAQLLVAEDRNRALEQELALERTKREAAERDATALGQKVEPRDPMRRSA